MADDFAFDILQSAADYELREKSLGSVHSTFHLDQPGLTTRSASAVSVLTAKEGKLAMEKET